MRGKKITLTMAAVDPNGICEDQTTAGAADLLLNGVLAASSGIATLGTALVVKITCAGDDSGRVFTVTGKDANGTDTCESLAGGSAGAVNTIKTFLEVTGVSIDGAAAGAVEVGTAENADSICASQTPALATELTLDGAATYVATLDVPRHVSIEAAGNCSDITFTFKGTDRHGDALSEVITGPNATTVKGVKNFKTVSAIRVSGAVTGDAEIGTTDELESQLIPVNSKVKGVGFQVSMSSDGNFQHWLKYTRDDVLGGDKDEHSARYTIFTPDGSKAADEAGVLAFPITAVRLAIDTWVAGSVDLIVVIPGVGS